MPVHNAVCTANWPRQLHFNADVELLHIHTDCQWAWAGTIWFTFPETLVSSHRIVTKDFRPTGFFFKPFIKIHLFPGSCRSCSLPRDTPTGEWHRSVTAKRNINKMETHPANQGTSESSRSDTLAKSSSCPLATPTCGTACVETTLY